MSVVPLKSGKQHRVPTLPAWEHAGRTGVIGRIMVREL